MYENMYNHLHTLWIYRIYAYVYFSLYIYTHIYIYIIYIYNVKSGLINPSRLINHHCPFFLKFKNRWSPQINKHFGLLPIKKPPVLKSIIFIQKFQMVSLWFPYDIYIYLSWNRMNTRTHHCWSLNIWKNNYSPNDRFLIKFCIKIISLDEPMSPINNNQGLPLINQPPCP